MTRKIESRIVSFRVLDPSPATATTPPVEHVHEKLERPAQLTGATYKIKTPDSAHALYVTINDIVLNPGTSHELRRPFEVFINSKNMDHFQWIVALTRIISAVFRKGGDVTFLVEELRGVFDPRGGYFKPGGRFVPSLISEIGDVVETHLRHLGMIAEAAPDSARAAFLAEKSAALGVEPGSYPEHAELCLKCHTKAAVYLDGCFTCLQCGDSKCG